jgi:hypothetical protein
MAGPLGSTPGIIVGVGVGAAASAALAPAIELPKQKAWADNANRILDAATLARLVAQGGVTLDAAKAEGLRDGYGPDKIQALAYLAQTVPGLAEALDLWRRLLIDDRLFEHALNKAGLDHRYVNQFLKLKEEELLSVPDLAYAVVRGLVPDEGILPVAPPAQGVKVKRFPVFPINPVEEAAKQGWSKDRFSVMVGRAGLAMAPILAANAYFRGVIARADYDLAIAEGDIRNEFRDAILDTAREILTAHDYAELELRGFLTRDERLAETDKHGMSARDSDLLYDVLGRAVGVHAITTGLARGGHYPSVYADVPEPYRAAIQRSNIRPEWASLAYANRYTYPSAFVLRSLTQAGDLTQAETHQILLDIGWRPDLAEKVSTRWAGGTGTTAGPYVKKAQTQLWTTAHKSYVAEEVDAAAAQSAMTALGVPAADQAAVLVLWDHERALIRKELSAKEVKRAWVIGAINPATGAKWTRQEAFERLLQMGYSAADATTFLEE